MRDMFTSLSDPSLQRTALQAVGFYIAWLLLLMFFSGLICGIAAPIVSFVEGIQPTFQNGCAVGAKLAPFIGVIACAWLAHHIVRSKGIGTVGNRLLVLLAGVLAFFGGAILGLIPVAFLTTRQSFKINNLVEETK